MDYNTSRGKLILPEYGRNIHKMVEQIKREPSRDKRNQMSNAMLKTMFNINSNLRGLDEEETKRKLWDHLFIIADFDLDVDSPFPKPTREQFNSKPSRIPYPRHTKKFRHYGGMMHRLLMELTLMEDGEKKDKEIARFANHMKKLYLAWNGDSVNDEQIFEDIRIMTNNKITIPQGLVLVEIRDNSPKPKPKKKTKNIRRR